MPFGTRLALRLEDRPQAIVFLPGARPHLRFGRRDTRRQVIDRAGSFHRTGDRRRLEQIEVSVSGRDDFVTGRSESRRECASQDAGGTRQEDAHVSPRTRSNVRDRSLAADRDAHQSQP